MLRNAWMHYLGWRRERNARNERAPEWNAGIGPTTSFWPYREPVLFPSEERILASHASVAAGWWGCTLSGTTGGDLWLTDRRLIFEPRVVNLWSFTHARIEVRRDEIVRSRLCSPIRSLLGLPFLRVFEVWTIGNKRYFFQPLKARRWVEELNKTPAMPIRHPW
jgi:hypothetical protein